MVNDVRIFIQRGKGKKFDYAFTFENLEIANAYVREIVNFEKCIPTGITQIHVVNYTGKKLSGVKL